MSIRGFKPIAALLAVMTLSARAAAQDAKPGETLVLSGLAWHQVAAKAKPGDTILLEKGFHISGSIEDLHGTRSQPITIRGADPHFPSAIACEETGIELHRCSWIRLENLYFINPREAAIVIDGAPRAGSASPNEPMDVSIAVSACKVSTSREMRGMDCIRIRHARNVGISQCRFEGWSEAAVDIRSSAAVVVTRCFLTSNGEWPRRCGVRALEGSSIIAVHQNTFERGIEIAVQAGRCLDPDGAPQSSPAENVSVVRSLMLEVGCPLEVGPDSSATLDQCTIVEPTVAVRLDGRCGTPKLTMSSNIVQWTPGRLKATADRLGRVDEALVRLDRNLWWSEEIPACFEVVGRPFGVEIAPQVFGIDPKLDEREYRPLEPRAAEFGWRAAVDAVPPAPAKPVSPSSAPGAGTQKGEGSRSNPSRPE